MNYTPELIYATIVIVIAGWIGIYLVIDLVKDYRELTLLRLKRQDFINSEKGKQAEIKRNNKIKLEQALRNLKTKYR